MVFSLCLPLDVFILMLMLMLMLIYELIRGVLFKTPWTLSTAADIRYTGASGGQLIISVTLTYGDVDMYEDERTSYRI